MTEFTTTIEAVQQSDLQSSLTSWGVYVNQVEQGQDEFKALGYIPGNLCPDEYLAIFDVLELLKTDQATPESLLEFMSLRAREEVVKAKVFGREPYSRKVRQAVVDIGADSLTAIMSDEPRDGILHQMLINEFEEVLADDDVIDSYLDVLKGLYGASTATELLRVRSDDDEYSARIRASLSSEQGLKQLYRIDNPTAEKDHKTQSADTQAWMAFALSSYLGSNTPEDFAPFVFSGEVHYENKDFAHILEMFDYFGLERIQKVANFTGIHGLEGYSISQIERMERLIDQPHEVATELANHDVVAVFINRVGDHNAVLRETAEHVDDDSGRVLFFEINSLPDIYRYSTRLARLGVRPSSIILASHSNKGQFMVSDYREPSVKKRDIATIASSTLVRAYNNTGERKGDARHDRAYSISGLAGLTRLVEDFMTESRAIDDDHDALGRKKIIFSACYAAAEYNVTDLDVEGREVKTGEDSVVGKLAKELSRGGLKSKVDIYGASEGMQLHRTATGLRYSAQPVDSGLGRVPLHAVRVRIDAGIEKTEVDEIPLRKAVD